MSIPESDLRFDTWPTGKVRVTHIPTGMWASSTREATIALNREAALVKLERLLEDYGKD